MASQENNKLGYLNKSPSNCYNICLAHLEMAHVKYFFITFFHQTISLILHQKKGEHLGTDSTCTCRVPTPLCELFSMTKLISSMTKFRHIPGIKLLKNAFSSITSHRLDKNVHHNIFFIDKYFFHEFSRVWAFFSNSMSFPGLKNKIAIFPVFHDA